MNVRNFERSVRKTPNKLGNYGIARPNDRKSFESPIESFGRAGEIEKQSAIELEMTYTHSN